jgi:hypothetical protein
MRESLDVWPYFALSPQRSAMRKTIFAAASLVLIASACLLPSSGTNQLHARTTPTPPRYCSPCLFYGGDFDINGPSPNALPNQNALDNGQAAVYVPFAVPPNQTWTVAGVFSNNMLTVPNIAPPQVQWSISAGISQGNAGTVIASGTTSATLTPTGRSWNGMNEYTVLGRFTADQLVTLTPGHYWMTAVPVCTYQGVQNPCVGAVYYMSDVEDVPPPQAKGFESTDESYLTWVGTYYFQETGGPNGLCSQVGGGGGCDKFSAGLIGRAQTN